MKMGSVNHGCKPYILAACQQPQGTEWNDRDEIGNNEQMSKLEHPLARQATEIASGDRKLGQIMRLAGAFERLDAHLRAELPASARPHVRIVRIDGSCLVIAADSSAWAMRARTLAAGLLAQAQAMWPGKLDRTRVVVAPSLQGKR